MISLIMMTPFAWASEVWRASRPVVRRRREGFMGKVAWRGRISGS